MTDILQGAKYRLYQGDCLEVMKGFPDGYFDACVTDPPYGIDFKYSQHDDTPEGYGEWIWNVIETAEGKCKPGSPIFVFQAMPNVRMFSEWFPRDFRIFAACKNFVQMRPSAMQYAFDPVLVWWKDGEKPYSTGTSSRDWYVANTNPSSRFGLNSVEGHPCPRPLDQMYHIVNQWVKPEGITLDCFLGSGTTGVACAQLGRRFVGIELDPDYFAIAQKRIETAYAQPLLFDSISEQKDDFSQNELFD